MMGAPTAVHGQPRQGEGLKDEKDEGGKCRVWGTLLAYESVVDQFASSIWILHWSLILCYCSIFISSLCLHPLAKILSTKSSIGQWARLMNTNSDTMVPLPPAHMPLSLR